SALGDGRKRTRIHDRQDREDLAVDADVRLLEGANQAGVRRPVRASGRVDAGHPQAAEVALAQLAADVGVLPGLVDRLDGDAVQAGTCAPVTLGVVEDAVAAT